MQRFIVCVLVLCLFSIIGFASAQDEVCGQAFTLADYESEDNRAFIRIENWHMMSGNSEYHIKGVNYYPVRTPWRRFLRETNIAELDADFELMRSVGLNTLRIFLWNPALFQCNGESIQPVDDAFERLDAIIHTASQYGFRLIITLNDMPELDRIPLYENPPVVQEQTRFIIARYLDEPTILAWDLKNEGDLDYGSADILQTKSARVQVLQWLKDTSQLVRAMDNNHLITAGWLNEAHSTAPYVDFVSFHHWSSADDLARRIRAIRYATNKPILLEEFGYSTFYENITPAVQAELIESVIQTTLDEDLLGWMVWTAFDFPFNATCYPSPCESPHNQEHYFGIWSVNDTPKPALEVIRQYAG